MKKLVLLAFVITGGLHAADPGAGALLPAAISGKNAADITREKQARNANSQGGEFFTNEYGVVFVPNAQSEVKDSGDKAKESDYETSDSERTYSVTNSPYDSDRE